MGKLRRLGDFGMHYIYHEFMIIIDIPKFQQGWFLKEYFIG